MWQRIDLGLPAFHSAACEIQAVGSKTGIWIAGGELDSIIALEILDPIISGVTTFRTQQNHLREQLTDDVFFSPLDPTNDAKLLFERVLRLKQDRANATMAFLSKL